MKKENFNHLMGKTRHEIKKELGDGFNFFTDDTWTYQLGRTWIGRRIILALHFKDGNVAGIDLYKTFNRS
ncbi:hypothetical protein C1637_23770 [Chryseobacterium lactis]|uniref:Uncharacterized protein n=1 Tax=Chryseobacterium lactis TaxID=1241981 RepID=A0A3G6RF66_CHRLC|nr:hypothetical protein [Chryseobacterium lactis]AZA83306.1 hypothetical protein EG342_16100 [Chryseobacterium lactis]AZB03691.1 hypothetical protein EG341_06975 [Chryseobacterium lactis]PNW11101.1 hypothetical protein C1637_23770 [Chryseobacterium lactis]